MHTIKKQSDLRAGNIICFLDSESDQFKPAQLSAYDLLHLKLENDQTVQRMPITIKALREVGFHHILGGRKMSLRGKQFTFVVENKHKRDGNFELELILPVVKKIDYMDELQNIFHSLEGYELDTNLLI
jgi:hypothetical protein